MREPRLVALVDVPRSTFRHWRKLEVVVEGPGGTFDEGDVIAVTLLAALRDHLGMEEAATVWAALQRQGKSGDLITRARKLELDADERFDLVVEKDTGIVQLATDDTSLVEAVRHPEHPRTVRVIPLADRLRHVRQGFYNLADQGPRPPERATGRPAKSATVTALRDRRSR
jgi:hypothetical protein